MTRKMVFVCSPLSGDIPGNRAKAEEFCRKLCTAFGVMAMAPHAYFTRFLDDENPDERLLGMELGKQWLMMCDEVWVFGGRVSRGMADEIAEAYHCHKTIVCMDDETKKAVDAYVATLADHFTG